MVKKKVAYDPSKVGVDEKELLQIKITKCENTLAKLNKKYKEAI